MCRPGLFERYLIVSPSLWWDEASMIQGAGSFGTENPDIEKWVLLSMGTEPEAMHTGMSALPEVLDGCADGLRYEFQPFPEETHATVHHRAVYAGFEYFFGEEYPGL